VEPAGLAIASQARAYCSRGKGGRLITYMTNLMERAPHLKPEDWEEIAVALGVGPSGLLPQYRYYRDAARDISLLILQKREVVIARLRRLAQQNRRNQIRATLRKLEMPLAELIKSSLRGP
jgi:hypothetical protein